MNAVDVLVIEDTPWEGEMTLRALTRCNPRIRAHWVRGGAAGLDFLYARNGYAERKGCAPPRLVLLDLKMPTLTGFEVLRRLEKDAALRRIPVVALTSSHDDRDVEEAYDLGVNSYVVKPMDVNQLFEKIKLIVGYWLVENSVPRSRGTEGGAAP